MEHILYSVLKTKHEHELVSYFLNLLKLNKLIYMYLQYSVAYNQKRRIKTVKSTYLKKKIFCVTIKYK